MTDTASQVAAPETSDEVRELDSLACFDRDGSAVFASLCRVTAGDRLIAADALRDTFVHLQRSAAQGTPQPTSRAQLLLAAHRVYLADQRAENDCPHTGQQYNGLHSDGPDRRLSLGGPDWALGLCSQTLAALRGLTSRERTALNLHHVDGFEVGEVAELLRQPEAEVMALLESGEQALRVTGINEPLADILRHAEMWLGDDERDDVRVALGAPSQRAAPDIDETGEESRRGWRLTKGSAIAAVVVGALAAAGVRWVQTLPEDKTPAPVTVDEPAESVVTSDQVVYRVTADGETIIDVTKMPDALADPEVIFMASGLTDPLVVVPDAILKYSDGTVGLSWHSPCNRPALAVALTNTATGAVVELTTGEFPVVSCISMPSRWTAVIAASFPLAEGPIRPVDRNGTAVSSFDGYAEANASTGTSKPIGDDAGYSSALVDGANQPWVYGIGCSSRSARYQSPIGAIFEIRTEPADSNSYSASDAIVCNKLAARPLLSGPFGAKFPQPYGNNSGDPTDCMGPFGSQTEVPNQPPYITREYDGDWSTWDGCLVNSDVIFSKSVFDTCPLADLRTITFAATIGERMTSLSEPVTYIRDPGQVVDGTRLLLLTSVPAPSDLNDTGLRFGKQELWLSPRSMEAIYVRVGEVTEHWPRLTDEIVCS